jgi:hypothetical protein
MNEGSVFSSTLHHAAAIAVRSGWTEQNESPTVDI